MSSNEITRKQELLEAHKERLHQRELQAAKYGMSADPSIKVEVQEIRGTIKNLEQEITVLLERDKIGQDISSLLHSQNITTERLANSDGSIDIRKEIRHVVERTVHKFLDIDSRVEVVAEEVIADTEYYVDVGNALALIGQWLIAATYYNKYAEQYPYDWAAHYMRGVAYQNSRAGKGANVAALRAYSDAIACAPDDLDINFQARLHTYRGAALKRLDRLEEAESEFLLARKWAREPYETIDVAYNLACVYAMKRQKKKMLSQLQIVAQDPQWREVIKRKREYFLNFWSDVDFQRIIQ